MRTMSPAVMIAQWAELISKETVVAMANARTMRFCRTFCMLQLNTRGFDEPAVFTWGRVRLHGLKKARFDFMRTVCIQGSHQCVGAECCLCFSFDPNVINILDLISQPNNLKCLNYNCVVFDTRGWSEWVGLVFFVRRLLRDLGFSDVRHSVDGQRHRANTLFDAKATQGQRD